MSLRDSSEKVIRRKLSILRVLRRSGKPLPSSAIAEGLQGFGHDVSERTVRLYLQQLDQEGMTENLGKQGRRLTPAGQQEVSEAFAYEKVGLLASKIDNMTYRMDFDLETQNGTVVVNTSLVDLRVFRDAIPLIKRVFASGYAMGTLMALHGPGERCGDKNVPPGKVGISTVCSITLNGVLLAHGIPVFSKFGGLVEIRDFKPTRFVELIHYGGTTVDPLEIFIRSGMTNYVGATETGQGRIGAGLREVPAESREVVQGLSLRLKQAGLGGIMVIGSPGQPVLEIPVEEDRVAVGVIGGLNPMAILRERGFELEFSALDGLAEYKNLFHFEELDLRARPILS
ncbi:MAG: DUF128 domain-containing protein [Candidatus Omnitrophica bacterium]|nr:DUF128 domain-containing protein [Candidatus Omnitrophota bacterium]